MSLPVEPLRSILKLEQKRQYADVAVIGGIDRYLVGWIAGLGAGVNSPGIIARLRGLHLVGSRYAVWPGERRQQWVDKVIEFLNRVEAGTEPFASVETEPLTTVAKHTARSNVSPVAETKPAAGLDGLVTSIKGFTPSLSDKLGRLGVRTIRDLLYFFPKRHLDYSERKFIANLEVGEDQTVVATVWQAHVVMPGGRRSTEAIIGDETGNMRALWFNQPYLAAKLNTNSRIALSGRVGLFKGQKIFESPEWEPAGDGDGDSVNTGRLVPVYSLTRGLYPRQLRRLIKSVVDSRTPELEEFIPNDIRARCHLVGLHEAVGQAHFPLSRESVNKARRRLAFDELFLFQLGVLGRKHEWQESQPANPVRVDRALVQRVQSSLPFTLTRAQKASLDDVLSDLQKPEAMSRLLQGDVGSGKTAVAVLALIVCVAGGFQGAFMAPTEILAEQHYRNVCHLLEAISSSKEEGGFTIRFHGILERPIGVSVLTGSLSGRNKTLLHESITSGETSIVVGTHALIQKGVSFKKLGLAVIDEQHRFGVVQRSTLRQKGFNPHILAMTATPIPRTMALTLYGDLDLSVINELPPGRQPVKTRWVYPEERQKAYDFLRRQVAVGRQAFVICPLVEESEAVAARAAVAEYDRLSQSTFPDLRLGLLHGRMSSEDKDSVMAKFRSGELQILVSTSVVEVGIDIPNATVMLVEGADRFGLSQLHQFRGRVGRGAEASYCLLLADNPSDEGRERLRLIERIHNGFVLAEEDLKLRGPGEFFGTRQSGLPDFRMARLSDIPLLELARNEANRLFQAPDLLKEHQFRPLITQLGRVWPGSTEWS